MTLKDNIAAASGAALGFVMGDVAGAVMGYKAGKYLSQMTTKRKAGNVKRTKAKRRKTTHPRKNKTTHKRAVATKKLSKVQRKQTKAIVKRTLECDFNSSIYHKNYSGDHKTQGAGSPSVDVWGAFQRNGINLNPYNVFALALTPFNIRKLLDAASVLYNGKAANIDYSTLTGNFDVKKTKVTFQHCSYALFLKNNSSTTYNVEMIIAKTKRNSPVDFLSSYANAIGSTTWVDAPPTINDYGMRPQILANLKTAYDMKSTFHIVEPGQHLKYYNTFKGCVDFGKYTTVGEALSGTLGYAKGVGEEIIFVMHPVLAIAGDGTNVRTGHFNRHSSGVTLPSRWVIEVNETYKVMQPDETPDAQEGEKRKLFNDFEDGSAFTDITNVFQFKKEVQDVLPIG